jgi:hypothetical protein
MVAVVVVALVRGLAVAALVATVRLAITVILGSTTLATLLDGPAGERTKNAAYGSAFETAAALIPDDTARGGADEGSTDRGISPGRDTMAAPFTIAIARTVRGAGCEGERHEQAGDDEQANSGCSHGLQRCCGKWDALPPVAFKQA